jgi:Zn-finger nucleic acid-binding protein
VWVSAAVFDAICQTSEARGDALAASGFAARRRRRFELTLDDQVRYIPCPVCKRLMNRRNFASVSGVIIDICRDDGVWFDNQELGRIVQFIEAGGLDKAREVEAREREHSQRMKAMAAHSATPGEFGSLPHYSVSTPGTGLDAAAAVFGRVLSEVAKSFFKGL